MAFVKRWLIAVALLLGLSAPAHAAVTCTAGLYVDENAVGDDSGLNWSDARPSLMIDWGPIVNDGETICVNKDHDENTAGNIVLTGTTAKSTIDAAVIVCVDDDAGAENGSLCGAAERAKVRTSGTNDISLREKLYIYGVQFFGSNNILVANSNAHHSIVLEQGRLELTTASIFDIIFFGYGLSKGIDVQLIDVDIDFIDTGQGIEFNGGSFLWNGGTLDFNVTDLVETVDGTPSNIVIRNVDLSILSNNVVKASGVLDSGRLSLERCEFHASTTLVNGTIDVPGFPVVAQHCQSGSVTDPPFQMEQVHYQGTIQTSTSNVRTGGASDGTTTVAWEFDADGSNYRALYEPLCSTIPIARWVSGGSSITAKIHLAGPAGLDNTEAWVTWSIPPVGATSLGIRESSRALPGSSAALTPEDGETWTSGTKYSISTDAFTPAEDGVLLAWPCIAYDSGTDGNAWFDPKIIVE